MQKPTVRTPDAQHLHVVVRFLRKVTLPRFAMAAGETFGFVVVGKHARMVHCILRGDRFDFGGGQVVPEDVEVAFLGPCSSDYLAAAGCGASVVPVGPEPFALDFFVSAQASSDQSGGARQSQLCTVSGIFPVGRHLGSGHWADILNAIAREFVDANQPEVQVHFAGGLPLAPLAQGAKPLKIENLRVHRKGMAEPAYPLLTVQP